MTSRQAGRRIGTISTARRNGTARRRSEPPRQQGAGRRASPGRRTNEALKPQEYRRLAQLVACGSIFVLLVAAKLLLPAKMEAFNEKLTAALERNMDVQEVFAAVGRVFDGGVEDRVGELYQAVFGNGGKDVGPSGSGVSERRGHGYPAGLPEGSTSLCRGRRAGRGTGRFYPGLCALL